MADLAVKVPTQPLLRVSTVARLFDVSETTVRRLVHDGALPHVRLSERAIRIPREAVCSLLRGSARFGEEHVQ